MGLLSWTVDQPATGNPSWWLVVLVVLHVAVEVWAEGGLRCNGPTVDRLECADLCNGHVRAWGPDRCECGDWFDED